MIWFPAVYKLCILYPLIYTNMKINGCLLWCIGVIWNNKTLLWVWVYLTDVSYNVYLFNCFMTLNYTLYKLWVSVQYNVTIWVPVICNVTIWVPVNCNVTIWVPVYCNVTIWVQVNCNVTIWIQVNCSVTIWVPVKCNVTIWVPVNCNLIIWVLVNCSVTIWVPVNCNVTIPYTNSRVPVHYNVKIHLQTMRYQ